ncbi:Multiple epidermal growth factor-like domains protein 8 [Mortierella alpina]|nr:Multiple epidermal growth factor-like domains protein 8 [Mortierella alpina]
MANEVNPDHCCWRQRKYGPLSLLLTCLAAFSVLFPSQVQSAPAPLPVSGAAFARSSTRFYIQGGTFANVNYGQFFSLDLAVGWNTTAPAWKQLSDGPQQNIYPAVFSADQQTMITFHSGGATFAYRYSVAKDLWTASTLQVQFGGYQGVGAVTDPNTGLVYLAGGYTDGSRNTMNVYNFNTDTIAEETPMPEASSVFPNRAYYTNVWSQKRGSILYFGGYNTTLKPIPNGNVVSEFVPSTKAWSTLSTTGTPPTMRADHCMASNDDGSLVIVYGGRPVGNAPFSGEVFILDTVSLVWKQGTPGPPRLYTTCTVAGDQLIIWGGVDGNDVVALAPVYIYSISTNNWITQYVPPASYVAARKTESAGAPTPTDANGSTNPSGSGAPGPGSKPTTNNAGAIAGGVVGGVAIICACVLFFVFKRRKNRGSPVSTTGDQDDMRELKQQPPTSQNRGDDEIERLRMQLQNQQEQLELQRRLLQLQQQQQQHMPVQPQPHQYQDLGYNYQPPIFYSAAASAEPTTVMSPCPVLRTSPGPMNTLPAHSGYVQGNTQYVGNQPAVFSPLLTTTAATPTALLPDKTPAPMMANGAKHDSNYWEERAPGNPHALIET